jgi:hypothetical protein
VGSGKHPLMMEPSYEKLLVRLAKADVRFVVVGGIAVTLQGYARFTEDIDLLLERGRDNITRLLEVLSDYGEGFARELVVDDFEDDEGAIRIIEEAEMCQMDLFMRLSGVTYEEAIIDADRFSLDGHWIHYASKSTLIRWKQKSVREKDRLDASALDLLQRDPHAFDA